MSALKIVGVALAAVMLILVLKKENAPAAFAVSVAAGVLILLSAVSDISKLVSYLRGIVPDISAAESLTSVLKCVGIGYVTAFGAATCSDMGEKGLADKVTLVGRILILVAGLPLVTAFLETVGEMLS